jgi:hypothetical protein
MRVEVSIKDLTQGQRRWLRDNVWNQGDVSHEAMASRMCVMFLFDEGGQDIHRDMPVRAFINLISRLETVLPTWTSVMSAGNEQ